MNGASDRSDLTPTEGDDFDFLSGVGDVPTLYRNHDWSASSLGKPEIWPQALRTVVALMLSSRFPMFVAWGPELAFLYNDAYAPILGTKHPHMLGRPFREAWSEIWDDISPLIESALAGVPTYNEDLHLVMERHGYPEETWYSFSYSPVFGDDGAIAGMFCACTENTERVKAEIALRDSEARVRALADHLPGAVVYQITTNAQGEGRQFVYLSRRYEDITGIPTEKLLSNADFAYNLIHEDDREKLALAEQRSIGTMEPLDIELRYRLGDEIRWGRVISAPRKQPDGTLIWDGVQIDITEQKLAHDALRESEERSRGVLENMREAFGLLDPELRTIELNAEALRMDGRPREQIFGRRHEEAHPNASPELLRLYRKALTEKVPVSLEHNYVWPDGRDSWIEMRAYPVGDNLAVFYRDVTERKKEEMRKAALAELADATRDMMDPADIAFAAAEMLGKTLNVSRAGYGTIDKDAETIFIERDWNAPGIKSLAGTLHFRDYGSYIEQLKQGITVAFADAEKDPRTSANADALKAISAQAVVNMPVTEQGNTVALLYLNNECAREWTDDELDFVHDVADRTRTLVERRRNEQALIESEERFRQIANTAPVPMWVTLLDRTRGFVNDAYLEFLGVDYDTALAFDWRTILHPDDHDRILAESVAGEASLEPFELEGRYRGGDGEWHVLRSRSKPRWDADGNHIGFIGVAHDITEERNAQTRLMESDARFRFLDWLAVATQEKDRPEDVMAAATRMLGEHLGVDICAYADVEADNDTFHIRRDWTRRGVKSIVGDYSLDSFGPIAAAAERGGQALVIRDMLAELGEEEARTFTSIDVAATICLPLVKHGRLTAMMAVHSRTPRDWTDAEISLVREVAERCWAHIERVGAHATLRESERRFRDQFENANDFIFTTDLQMVITSCNPAVAAALERSIDELIGTRISDYTPPETWALNQRMLADKLAGKGDATRYEVEVFDRSGARMTWEINSRLMRDEAGRPLGLHAIARDVSERNRDQRLIEEARHRAETEAAKQSAILGQLAEGVIIADASGRITFINDAAKSLHGVAALGVEPSEYAPTFGLFREDGSLYPNDELPLSRAVQRGETVRDERWRIRRPDGSEVLAIGNAQPVIGPDGIPIGAVLTIRDDTARHAAEQALRELNETLEERVAQRTDELEQTQEALRQSQKLEAMGQLTGGVAHDFNNLLTPILGSLDLLQRRGIGDERERRLIDGALQSAERAKLLVQRLLAFARRQPLKPVAVDMRELIGNMAELLASTCGPNVRVSVHVDDHIEPALADPNQIEMAILNLSVNARDAMPDGGRLTLSATTERVEDSGSAGLPAGRYIRISVTDTGAGMDEETQRRAIEPFFSTKGIGRGTGLGLSMVHGLASQLGGALKISSTPGVGTNVELWLPVSETVAEQGQPASPQVSAETKAGTVLLVDDEPLVRASTADMLHELGFAVIEADSADAALALAAQEPVFDLLVTDHLMPGKTGVDLAMALREQRADLPVLIVSGYAETDSLPQLFPRLTKPFRQADLAAAIAAIFQPEDAVS
jgi:PAS domain S-box-containing protein